MSFLLSQSNRSGGRNASLPHIAVSHVHEDVVRYLSKCFSEIFTLTDVDAMDNLAGFKD